MDYDKNRNAAELLLKSIGNINKVKKVGDRKEGEEKNKKSLYQKFLFVNDRELTDEDDDFITDEELAKKESAKKKVEVNKKKYIQKMLPLDNIIKSKKRKNPPGYEKYTPDILHSKEYVDTSDDEAYNEKKLLKKSVDDDEGLLYIKKKKEDKELYHSNRNDYVEYYDTDDDRDEENDYFSSKTSLKNKQDVEVAIYEFKHDPKKLYVDYLKRIDKANETRLTKIQKRYLKSQNDSLNEQERKEIQPKFMEEFLDKIHLQKELYPETESIELIAAPYLGKEWKRGMNNEDKLSQYKSLVNYYGTLGFEVDAEKFEKESNDKLKDLNREHDTYLAHYMLAADNLYNQHVKEINEGKFDNFDKKMEILKERYKSDNYEIIKEFAKLPATAYDKEENKWDSIKTGVPKSLPQTREMANLTYFADYSILRRPMMMLDGKKFKIKNKDLMVKQYAENHLNVPMKSNLKNTKSIVKKKLEEIKKRK